MQNISNAPAVKDDKEIKLVQEGIKLFENLPSIMKANKLSEERAQGAMQTWLDKFAANDYKMTAELDVEAQSLLVKINATITKMEDQRKPVTQIFDAIKKMFTALENTLKIKEVGTKAAIVQQYRDEFARWCVEEEKRKQRELEEKAAVEKEKNDLIAWVHKTISEILTSYIFNKKQQWQNSFNAITLADFHEKENKIYNVSTVFNAALLNKQHAQCIIKYQSPTTPKLDGVTKTLTEKTAETTYDFNSWIQDHNNQMQEFKQTLIDRLPAKKQELEEAAEAEAKRLAEIKRQEEAERLRQEQIKKANAAEKAKLEAQAKIDREKEVKRLAELEEQKKKQDAEKLQREKEDQFKLEQEKLASDKNAADKIEAHSASMHAATLFDTSVSLAETTVAPESRQGYDITVTNPAGFMELISLWFNREGIKMSTDELEKVTFGRVKKYWEGVAAKTDEKITSKYLRYDVAVKAVNRKEKK